MEEHVKTNIIKKVQKNTILYDKIDDFYTIFKCIFCLIPSLLILNINYAKIV